MASPKVVSQIFLNLRVVIKEFMKDSYSLRKLKWIIEIDESLVLHGSI